MKKLVLLSVFLLFFQMSGICQEPEPAAPKDKEYEFVFNPPPGISYTTIAKSSLRKHVSGRSPQTTKGIIKSRVNVKKTDLGYVFITEPLSLQIFENGRMIDNPVQQLIQDCTVSIETDFNGEIVSLKGYEGIEEDIRKKFGAKLYKTLTATVNVEALSDQARLQWETRLKGLVGRKVKKTMSWAGTDSYLLPDGSKAIFYTTSTVDGEVKCGESQCLKIQLNFDTDYIKLGNKVKDASEELISISLNTEKQRQKHVQINGQGERLIDPKTMFIHYENILKTIKIPRSKNDPRMTLIERNEYRSNFYER